MDQRPSGPILRVPVLAALLFGSGLCALVYQTAWLRSFRLIFGASTPATAAVLAIFMGGLGAGALVLGPRAQRHADPLRFYGLLELAIAIGAAASPFLLDVAARIYVAIGGTSTLGDLGATVLRLVLAAVIIGPPVFLMGGTLPAAGRAITSEHDVGRRGLAVIYGLNGLGGVAGTLLTTFVMLEVYGARLTLFAACTVNVAVAMVALRSSAPAAAARAAPAAAEPLPPVAAGDAGDGLPRAWALAAAFTTGFVFFLAEMVWFRMGSPILGGLTYTFGLILAVALAGIGAGGLLYAVTGARPRPGLFALTCALEALALLAPFAFGDELALLAAQLHDLGRARFGVMVAGWTFIAAIIVAPASVVAGYQFPLLLGLVGRADRDVAADVGRVYAANTLGSIAGALAGGFGLLPLLGAKGCWRLAALLVLAIGGGVALREARRRSGRAAAAAFAAVAVLALAAAAAEGPTALWRHGAIGAGRSAVARELIGATDANAFIRARNLAQAAVADERDGWEASLAFVYSTGLALFSNGKCDGDSVGDAPTQALLGLMGAIRHEDPRRAFVVGLGTGETVGFLAEVPSMERVTVVELEEGVEDYARLCAPTNFDVCDHAKVSLEIGDAREALLTTRETFDLIVSEPSNPYRAGMAGFYATDFYAQTLERLRPGGFFLQWLQDYEVDADSAAMAIASMRSVYAHVSVWVLPPVRDMVLVASREPQAIDVERVRARLGQHPYREGFGRLTGVYSVEALIARHIAAPALADAIHEAQGGFLNSDDVPRLDYLFARSVGKESLPSVGGAIRRAARARDVHRPALVTAPGAPPIDWDRVAYFEMRAGEPLRDPQAKEQRRQPLADEWIAALERGDLGAALAVARRAETAVAGGGGPAAFFAPPLADPRDRLALALARAIAPGADASPGARAARDAELAALANEGLASDARFIALATALAEGRTDDAVALARAAFAALRSDPWVDEQVLGHAVARLGVLAGHPSRAAIVADELLRGPFASFRIERERRQHAFLLAAATGNDELCARALELWEPWPEWQPPTLAARAAAYAAVRPHLAEGARADLELFHAQRRASLEELLGGEEPLGGPANGLGRKP